MTAEKNWGIGLSILTLDAINAEFIRASSKHNGRTPRALWMTDGERLAILVEEVGEVARSLTHDNADPENLVKELIQLAAMAAAWVESAEWKNASKAEAQRKI